MESYHDTGPDGHLWIPENPDFCPSSSRDGCGILGNPKCIVLGIVAPLTLNAYKYMNP